MNSKQQATNRIIFILSILGIIMAVYVLQSFLRDTGIMCLNGNGCELVRKNPISWPFGIPVPAFGLVGYTLLAILSFLRTFSSNHTIASRDSVFMTLMIGIGLFGVCFVTWFTFMEIFIIKGTCTWCALSAVNMFIIFGLIVYSFAKKTKSSQ
jgi:uncharacterized membrane protein